MLEAVTGLLADAHYRTRPSDLARWLEDPGVELLRMEGADDGSLFGVVLIQREAGLEPELARAVWAGQRRPLGHFLPCVLSAHGAFDLAAEGIWRIQRLAVHPAWQGRGLGLRLLRAVRDRARAEGVALIGASFGLQPGLLRFWQRAGYGLVRVGIHPDPASGQVSGVVLQAVAGRAQAPLARVQGALHRDWPAWRERLLPAPAAARVSAHLMAEADPLPTARACGGSRGTAGLCPRGPPSGVGPAGPVAAAGAGAAAGPRGPVAGREPCGPHRVGAP